MTNIQLYNRINYWLLFAGLILGVIFYDVIGEYGKFTFVDELFVGLLLAYSILRRKFSKEFFIFIGIALFYLAYSFMYPVNVPQAIWTDFLIEAKPYIAFYCAYNLGISLSPNYYKRVRRLCVLLAILMIPIGIMGISFMHTLALHPSRFATILAILGTLYFYCSKQDAHSRKITFLIWSIGLLSLRSKFFGFYAAAVFLFFMFQSKRFKLSAKTVVLLACMGGVIVFAAWEKISFYFIQGSQAESMFARPFLYYNAVKILNDYFPFGSGLGSYATYASDVWYSPIYFEYKMHLNHEIGNGLFLEDTFMPSLAQIGYVGVLLFFLFWYRIYKRGKDLPEYRMVMLIIFFFIIESTSDSTFTQNRGIYMLVLLAMYLNRNKYLQALYRRKMKKRDLVSNNHSDNIYFQRT